MDHIQVTTKEWLTPGGKHDITASEALEFISEAKTKLDGIIQIAEGLIQLYEPKLATELLALKDIAAKLITQL